MRVSVAAGVRRRRLGAVAVAVVTALAVAGPLVPQRADAAGTSLYPDIVTLPVRDLRLDRTDVSVDGSGVMHNVLRFTNTPYNVGEGRFELRAKIDPTTKTGAAYQRVYDTAGGFVDYPVGNIYYHAVHNHYHFDNWGQYQLWTKAGYDAWIASGRTSGTPSWTSPKTTSCVIDEEFIKQLPAAPGGSVYTGAGCQLDANNNLLEGLSPGWGDTYDWYRFEQWIDLNQATLGDGQYVLRSVTDPNNVLYESANKADPSRDGLAGNESTLTFTMNAGVLQDSLAPTGTVAINNVDAQTSTTSVNLKLLGRDDVSGVDQVRISNDGVNWATQSYTGQDSTPMQVAWNLADTRYGGSTTGGTRTVYAQFHDRSGKWGTSVTDTINLLACTAAPPTSSSYSTAVLSDGPVSYWRLGDNCGTAADQKSLNPGTFLNSPTLGQPSLLTSDTADKAVGFDGVDDQVKVPDSSSLDLTSGITAEAWIKPNVVPSPGAFASVLTKAEAYSLQFNGPLMEFTVMQGGVRRRLQAPSGAVVAGTTYHVVGTYDGVTQRLYLNGTQVASAALTGPATVGTNPLFVGSWNGSSEFFNGTIDEAAVYNKALTASQVAAHNTSGRGGPTPTAPNAPSSLVAGASGSSAVNLTWVDNSTNETGFVLDRSTSSSFTSPVSRSLGANVTTFSDTGLTASTTYFYRIKAVNGTLSSSYSNTASALTGDVSASTYATAVLNDGPVMFCRLGEASGTVAADQTGANPGTYVNGPTLAQQSLLANDTANTAVRFDGTNDQVRVADSASLDLTSAITLEAWIKPNALPATGAFASVLTKAEAYSLQFNGPRLEFTVMQSGARRRLQAPSGAVVAGTTYHVVGTYDGVTQRLYLNGTQVASAALSGPATVTTTPLFLGSWNGSSEFFNGTIDEAAVYNKVLTAARVSAHKTAGG